MQLIAPNALTHEVQALTACLTTQHMHDWESQHASLPVVASPCLSSQSHSRVPANECITNEPRLH